MIRFGARLQHLYTKAQDSSFFLEVHSDSFFTLFPYKGVINALLNNVHSSSAFFFHLNRMRARIIEAVADCLLNDFPNCAWAVISEALKMSEADDGARRALRGEASGLTCLAF